MIHLKDRAEAEEISGLGFELANFSSLPLTASYARQIEALRADARWIDNHMGDILRRIDSLREQIEDREEGTA